MQATTPEDNSSFSSMYMYSCDTCGHSSNREVDAVRCALIFQLIRNKCTNVFVPD